MAIKFDFNKLRTAITGFLTGTDLSGTALTSGEQAIYVPKLRQAMPLKHVKAAATLSASDSGSVVMINQAAAFAITLPNVKSLESVVNATSSDDPPDIVSANVYVVDAANPVLVEGVIPAKPNS